MFFFSYIDAVMFLLAVYPYLQVSVLTFIEYNYRFEHIILLLCFTTIMCYKINIIIKNIRIWRKMTLCYALNHFLVICCSDIGNVDINYYISSIQFYRHSFFPSFINNEFRSYKSHRFWIFIYYIDIVWHFDRCTKLQSTIYNIYMIYNLEFWILHATRMNDDLLKMSLNSDIVRHFWTEHWVCFVGF